MKNTLCIYWKYIVYMYIYRTTALFKIISNSKTTWSHYTFLQSIQQRGWHLEQPLTKATDTFATYRLAIEQTFWLSDHWQLLVKQVWVFMTAWKWLTLENNCHGYILRFRLETTSVHTHDTKFSPKTRQHAFVETGSWMLVKECINRVANMSVSQTW